MAGKPASADNRVLDNDTSERTIVIHLQMIVLLAQVDLNMVEKFLRSATERRILVDIQANLYLANILVFRVNRKFVVFVEVDSVWIEGIRFQHLIAWHRQRVLFHVVEIHFSQGPFFFLRHKGLLLPTGVSR
ncbi:hypothetical protein D3C81_955800 [compost metagenome]